MSRFYYGAISPLNVDQFSLRELSEYVVQMDKALADEERANGR